MTFNVEVWFLIPVVLVYALGFFMIVTGARHSYWAWTGQTEKLTTVFEGPLAEDIQTRRWLWTIGGPLVSLAGLALTSGLTWLLISQ